MERLKQARASALVRSSVIIVSICERKARDGTPTFGLHLAGQSGLSEAPTSHIQLVKPHWDRVCSMIVAHPRVPYILILEDYDEVANLLRDALSGLGARCFSLRSKALAEWFLNRVRPDLVIVDYRLLGQ